MSVAENWKQILFLALLCASCSTTPTENFKKIKIGMDKADVIEELGSPDRTFRADNQDVWIYQMSKEDLSDTREISFQSSRVNYSGLVRKKEITHLKTEEEAAKHLEEELKPFKIESPKVSGQNSE